MKKLSSVCCLLILLLSCQPTNQQQEHTESKRDTLVIIHRDTVFIAHENSATTTTPPAETKLITKVDSAKIEPKKIISKPETIPTKSATNDTIYYYYVNKKVSAKTTPWNNSRRMTFLYNLYGEETYRQEEVRMSYSVSIDKLTFHSNGAISTMKIHTNPGASRYWGETTITFGTTNDPIHKQSMQMPIENLNETLKPWEYWDSKTKQWRKQEVME